MWYVLHQGEGPPIHSKRLLHHESARNASHVLVVYAGVMALVLPIKWSLFFAGDIIGLVLPSNLLMMDGINPGGGRHGIVLVLSFGRFLPFLFPWYFSVDCWIQSFCILCLVPFGSLPLFLLFLSTYLNLRFCQVWGGVTDTA